MHNRNRLIPQAIVLSKCHWGLRPAPTESRKACLPTAWPVRCRILPNAPVHPSGETSSTSGGVHDPFPIASGCWCRKQFECTHDFRTTRGVWGAVVTVVGVGAGLRPAPSARQLHDGQLEKRVAPPFLPVSSYFLVFINSFFCFSKDASFLLMVCIPLLMISSLCLTFCSSTPLSPWSSRAKDSTSFRSSRKYGLPCA